MAYIFPSKKLLKNDPFWTFMKKLLSRVDHRVLEFEFDGISGKSS
jgi:hypothetical protein